MLLRAIGTSLLLLGLAGCVTTPPPRVSSVSGYEHGEYSLALKPASSGGLMSSDWRLDNLQVRQQYQSSASQSLPPTAYTDKEGVRYQSTYFLDIDGDGEYETEKTLPTYALLFEHRQHDGELFVRTIPVSTADVEKRSKVLMRRLVSGIAGASYRLVQLGEDRAKVSERRYAPVVQQEAEVTLAGEDAYYARLEVANIDQQKVDPDAPKVQVEFVLRKTDFLYRPNGRAGSSLGFPVLLLVGYANNPEEFEEGRGAFLDLLARISVEGRVGAQIPGLENKPSTPEPALDTAQADAESFETDTESLETGTEQPKTGTEQPETSDEETAQPPQPMRKSMGRASRPED